MRVQGCSLRAGGQRAAGPIVTVFACLGLACAGLAVVAPPAGAVGGSYVVRSTGDQADAHPGDGTCSTSVGTCTLRAALTEANLDHGPSSVSFAIPGTGPRTINIATALPTLTDVIGGTTIDGYTEPGTAVNTDPLVDNAVLRIEIRGTGSSGPDALDIASPNNVVRGISFYNLRLAVDMIFGGNDNAIVGDFIGTNAAGTFANTVSNTDSFGVVIDRLASDNAVGRPDVADRNVVSGNSGRGVMVKDAVLDNKIQNNIVGLSPNGRARLPNADHGIDVNSGATRTIVGGTHALEGNLVSGNDGHGIEVSHAPTGPTVGNEILGNRVGTDPTGNAGPAYARNGDRFAHENLHTEDHVTGTVIAYNIIGNSRFGGIKIDNASSGTLVHDNRIGVTRDGNPIPNGQYGVQIELGSHGTVVTHNIIANNRSGIRLQDPTTVDNTISENSIFANSRLGIDIAPLDVVNSASVVTPTNGGIHFPVLSGATASSVTGQACAGCRVELFVADSTTTDPSLESSYGEGRTFLAAGPADGTGNFTIQIPSASQERVVTATATSSVGNTSEFSRNLAVPGATGLLPDYRPFGSWDSFVARQMADFAGSPGTTSSRGPAVMRLRARMITPAAYIRSLMIAPAFDSNVAPVARLYTVYFGREPDYTGLTYWAHRHRSGVLLSAISHTFLESHEFQSRHASLSSTAFITFVYQSALGRRPDAAGVEYWVALLDRGTARSVLVTRFSESPEHKARVGGEVTIVEIFAGMLHRSASAREMASLAGHSSIGVIDSIRLGPEYARLIG